VVNTTFLFSYLVFMMVLMFMINQGAPNIVSANFEEKITPPKWDISGFDALVDALKCVVENLGMFFKLMSISTTIKAVGMILLTPFLVVLAYIIISLIRGNG